MKITEYFDRVYVLTLERRVDRRMAFLETNKATSLVDQSTDLPAKIPRLAFNCQWVCGYDRPVHNIEDPVSRPNGNFGCTASHRRVMELILAHGVQRALVLEDDAVPAWTSAARTKRVDVDTLFAKSIDQVPKDWGLLYLGGHYAEVPQKRIGPNVIRTGRMLTTSSYGITYRQAERMAPHIGGIGPIDNLFWPFNRVDPCYILEPRLFIQAAGHSDLHESFQNYEGAMMDPNHVRALDAGRQSL